jgi:succinate dehydrogenase/fumarate reductase cytochrome b subunit
VSFDRLEAWDSLRGALSAFNTLFIFLALLEYLQMFRALADFSETLKESAQRMLTVCVIIAIVMSGFAMAFHVAFGFRCALTMGPPPPPPPPPPPH